MCAISHETKNVQIRSRNVGPADWSLYMMQQYSIFLLFTMLLVSKSNISWGRFRLVQSESSTELFCNCQPMEHSKRLQSWTIIQNYGNFLPLSYQAFSGTSNKLSKSTVTIKLHCNNPTNKLVNQKHSTEFRHTSSSKSHWQAHTFQLWIQKRSHKYQAMHILVWDNWHKLFINDLMWQSELMLITATYLFNVMPLVRNLHKWEKTKPVNKIT